MLLDKIKQDRILALKNKYIDKKSILTVLMGEFSRLNTKEPSDDQVICVISKMVKSLIELEQTDKTKLELDILESYLPKQLSEEDLTEIIKGIVSTLKSKQENVKMKDIMQELRANYPNQYDGKLACQLITLIITNNV